MDPEVLQRACPRPQGEAQLAQLAAQFRVKLTPMFGRLPSTPCSL